MGSLSLIDGWVISSRSDPFWVSRIFLPLSFYPSCFCSPHCVWTKWKVPHRMDPTWRINCLISEVSCITSVHYLNYFTLCTASKAAKFPTAPREKPGMLYELIRCKLFFLLSKPHKFPEGQKGTLGRWSKEVHFNLIDLRYTINLRWNQMQADKLE